jgi:hypothetical protein
MGNSGISERERKVFQTGLFDNLTVQDAFTIVALYAAQIEIGDYKEDLTELVLEDWRYIDQKGLDAEAKDLSWAKAKTNDQSVSKNDVPQPGTT